jgi:hypothetical protein
MPPFPDIDIYLGYWLRTFSGSVNGGTMSIVMYLVMDTGGTRQLAPGGCLPRVAEGVGARGEEGEGSSREERIRGH